MKEPVATIGLTLLSLALAILEGYNAQHLYGAHFLLIFPTILLTKAAYSLINGYC